MPIVDHNNAPEVPWRSNHRRWDITRHDDGTTSTSMSYFVVGVGEGAPLHSHDVDEFIVVLEGQLEARLGDEVHTVSADHTLVIPPNTPHGFRSVGPGDARLLVFFPTSDPWSDTKFHDGTPPESLRR